MKRIIFILITLSLFASCKEEPSATVQTKATQQAQRIEEFNYMIDFDFTCLNDNLYICINNQSIMIKKQKYNCKACTFLDEYFPNWYEYNYFANGCFTINVIGVDKYGNGHTIFSENISMYNTHFEY